MKSLNVSRLAKVSRLWKVSSLGAIPSLYCNVEVWEILVKLHYDNDLALNDVRTLAGGGGDGVSQSKS